MEDPVPVWVKVMIGLAFFSSAVLAMITGCKNWLNKHLCFEIIIISLSALGCILSGVIGLILFFANELSLDAFGVILIGLLPGIEAASRLRLSVILANIRMRRKPALRNRLHEFQYLRHGKPPSDETNQKLGETCTADTYLRVSKSSTLQPQTDKNVEMWNGTILNYDEKVIVLKDMNNIGDAMRWWHAANNAVELVTDPSLARMSEQEQVVRALELVAEICMIGDSVFEYHGKALRTHAEHSKNLRKAMNATPASVCSAFLEAIGLLDEWGRVDDALKSSFIRQFNELNRSKQYGMLFFILLVESRIFDNVNYFNTKKRHYPDANRVINAFQESRESKVRKFITQQWLSRYGLTEDRLAKYNGDQNAGANVRSATGPTETYALIPLPINASAPHGTPEIRLGVNQLMNGVQNDSTIPYPTVQPPGGTNPSSASVNGDVPCIVPSEVSRRARIFMPITVPSIHLPSIPPQNSLTTRPVAIPTVDTPRDTGRGDPSSAFPPHSTVIDLTPQDSTVFNTVGNNDPSSYPVHTQQILEGGSPIYTTQTWTNSVDNSNPDPRSSSTSDMTATQMQDPVPAKAIDAGPRHGSTGNKQNSSP